jgi:hypothetical protein
VRSLQPGASLSTVVDAPQRQGRMVPWCCNELLFAPSILLRASASQAIGQGADHPLSVGHESRRSGARAYHWGVSGDMGAASAGVPAPVGS